MNKLIKRAIKSIKSRTYEKNGKFYGELYPTILVNHTKNDKPIMKLSRKQQEALMNYVRGEQNETYDNS